MTLPWTLKSYAEGCIKSDWTNYTQGDLGWSEALALAIDKFARDWIADNCKGKALAKQDTGIERLKEHFAKLNAQDVETNRRLRAALGEIITRYKHGDEAGYAVAIARKELAKE